MQQTIWASAASILCDRQCHRVPLLSPLLSTLQSTDQELLNFGKDSDDEMDSEGEGEEDEGAEEADEGAGAQPPAAKGKDKAGMTLEMVEGWCTAAKENATLGAVRNIMKVRCATSCRGAVSLQTERFATRSPTGRHAAEVGLFGASRQCHHTLPAREYARGRLPLLMAPLTGPSPPNSAINAGVPRCMPLWRQRGAGGEKHAHRQQCGVQQTDAVCTGE